MTTLLEIVTSLDTFDAEDEYLTIYAKPPRSGWTPDSPAMVARAPDDDYSTSPPAEAEGLEYFLEIFVARQVFKDPFFNGLDPVARTRRLIQYALHDA